MEFKNIKIGTHRKLQIIDIRTEFLPHNDSTKIVFTVIDERGKNKLEISDAVIKHPRNGKVIKAIYLAKDHENNIIINSTLGKVLQYYNCSTINDMLGKFVIVEADPKDYLVLIAY
jgi:hypothetical protein